MDKQPRIQQIIDKVIEEMCDDYCKMPQVYLAKYKDPDKAHDEMWNECCTGCPLMRL